MNFPIEKIRDDFPILHRRINNKPLVYFDNAATTHKPQIVIDTINENYLYNNSNIHRGVHYLSEKMTEIYETSRKTVQCFINAPTDSEIIFTSGTTHGINLVASSFCEKYLQRDDEIILSVLEHHSNIVPWQLMAEKKNARLRIIPINEKGELLLDEFDKLLNEKTKIVAISHISNSLGTINPIKNIIEKAHSFGVPVLIDGAQAIHHVQVDVRDLDCDFYVFSGHKIYGPTGIGVLYAKEKWLNEMPPYMGGGDMIDRVTFEKTTFATIPFKFEAGTTNFIGASGLAAAINYVQNLGLEKIAAYEKELLIYATDKLTSIPGLAIYGQAAEKTSVISFLLKNIHHFDTGMIIDKMGVAVRTGHHCTQPLMDYFSIEGTVRASFAFYNTMDEIDLLHEAILKVIKMFS